MIGQSRPSPTRSSSSPAVRKISFTGSTAVGKELISRSADQVKRLSLELGGHAPLIVFPDADVQQVAQAAVIGKFRNNGQVCIAPSRFYVHEKIAERLHRGGRRADPQPENGQRTGAGRPGRPDVRGQRARQDRGAGRRRPEQGGQDLDRRRQIDAASTRATGSSRRSSARSTAR